MDQHQMKEIVMLSHISTIANTIAINKKILEWLKQHNIVSVWELYTDRFDHKKLKEVFDDKDILEFKKSVEQVSASLDIKLSQEEIRDFYIKSHAENFRFNLDVMTRSFEEIRQSHNISTRLFNILTDSADLKYVWMLYANKHTVTTKKPFKETFLLWRGTSKSILNELELLVQKLDLPELDSIEFTENEISILEKIGII